MNDQRKKFLKSLINVHGPAGWEVDVQKTWLGYVEPFADEVKSDAYGNTFALLNPEGSNRVLFVGHADEVGFQISYINDKGYLYLARVGGIDLGLARGQRVRIMTRKGIVKGVIGSLAIHMQDAASRQKTVPDQHEFFIDIGATSKEEALERVEIGDPMTYDVGYEELTDKIWAARAADNRTGIFAAAETLRKATEFKDRLIKNDICAIAVSTIQEENGRYGATMVGYSLEATAAVVYDVGHSTDIPPCNPARDGDVSLGKGPILSRGSVNHPLVVEQILKASKDAKLPTQLFADSRTTGTDADMIFRERGGIPTALLSLPLRYMHSPVETFHLDDLENMSNVSCEFLRKADFSSGFSVKI